MKDIKRINADIAGAASLVASFAAGVPDDARVIFRGRNTVALVPGAEDFCVKAFAEPSALKGFIYGVMRKPKAIKAFDNAMRLRTLGFDTPEPVGAIACRQGLLLTSSCYICRYCADAKELRGVEQEPDFAPIAKALAAFMNRLHRAGVFMKDFTPGNVLWRREADGSYSFSLIDINRMAFGVTERSVLMQNFGAVLDTLYGATVLAHEYAALHDDSAVVEAECIEIYRRRQAKLLRRKKFKNLFR